MPPLDLRYLASELPLYMPDILAKAGHDIASNFIAKAVGAAARGAGRGARSIAASLVGGIQSKAALESFAQDWAAARDDQDREKAVRQLLQADPHFAGSAAALIQRRDYVIALRDYAGELPVAGMEMAASLPDVYVPLPILAVTSGDGRVEPTAPSRLASHGDHLVVGDAGSGKSSLLRHLAFEESRRLLDDDTSVAFDQLRLPVLVHAQTLLRSMDFASALRAGTMEALATYLRAPLPTDFFQPGAAEGHGHWLVLVYGVDEVEEPDRARLLRVVGSHAQRGDLFRFVLAGRPQVLDAADILQDFSRWSIPPLEKEHRTALIDRYLREAKLKEAFARGIDAATFKYIARRPIFLAMSASLFADTGELFTRKADLIGHFVEFLCDKVLDGDGEGQEILDSLFRSIAMGVETRALLIANNREIIERLIGARTPLVQERELDRLLLRTGLVRRTGDRYRFAHELLRYHFAALELSERHKPTADIVTALDPFRVGWDTISLLGQLWGQRGLDVNPMVRSLLEFGDAGLRCAAEIIVAVPSVSDSPAQRIVERLFREAKDRGPTILAQDLLTILAEAREAVRFRMIDELYSDDYLDGVFIAECLLDAGATDEALSHLLWLAKDSSSYSPDRVRAAELLLAHGHREEAMAALREVARDGDEEWAIVDAAVVLYRLERTAKNRERLAELLESESAGDFALMTASADLVSMGEVELALPRLRASAKITSGERGWRDRGDAIRAATAIGEHHDRQEGHALLCDLLPTEASLSENADVIAAISKLGFEAEARIVARDSLARNPLAVDWQSLRLLESLGLNEAAQLALEQALEHRLSDSRSTVHDIASLLDHIPDAVDPTPLAAIMRRHLAGRSEPRLISCLATSGSAQDARTLLAGLLACADLRQQVEIAGELCKLGEQKTGLPWLRRIARRPETPPEIRTRAAEKLGQVGLLRQAAFSFARLARDETVDVKRRAQAAISFDELLHSRNVLVWRCLMAILEDPARPVVDRVEAGNALLAIDGDDGYDDIVYPEIEAILDEDGLSDEEALVVGAALGERGWRLRHMRRVRSALMSTRVGLAARIDAIRSINLHDRNPEVDPVLAAIAADPGTPAKYAIEAARVLSRRRRTDKTLKDLAADESLPPAWRLEAITCRRPNLPSNELLRLARDESIAIERRIEAIDQLPKIASSKRGGALSKLATTPDLTFWEWLSIAEAAQRLGIAALRKRALRVAGGDSPLSIGERVALAQAHRTDGNEAAVRKVALETLRLPFPVWTNCDDGASVLEALEIGAAFDRAASIRVAKNLIQADQTGWWDAPGLIAFLAEQTSETEALAFIEPLSHELRRSLDEAGAEDEGWLYIAANFLAAGLFDDYAALIAFGATQARTLAERVHAYGLILRYASAQSPHHEAARVALEELRDDPSWSKDDRLSAAKRLRLIDLPVEAEAWLDRVTSSNGDDDHPRARARLLADLGRHDEARSVLKSTDRSALFQGFIFDRDEELLRSALGDDVVDSEMRAMALANDDPYDQIWRMKELVEKTGDRELLRVVRHRASDPTVHPDERLEAIDLLEQLGFRSLSREALAALDIREVDPAHLAGQLIRSGRKADARALLANAETSLSEDDTYRLSVMLDLGLAIEIGLVRKAEVEVA